MKVLMLWPDLREYWPRILKQKSKIENIKLDIEETFYNKGLIWAMLRKILTPRCLFMNIFIPEWKKNIDAYDLIMIQASIITSKLPEYLREKGYNGRIIYWYWDPVSSSIHPRHINRNYCELWSFDEYDCRKYKMKFCNTFFLEDACKIQCKNDEMYDFCFIGRDKGRRSEIEILQKKLNNLGYKTAFYIFGNKHFLIKKRYLLPYEDVIRIVKCSRCILDFNQKNQFGLSQRIMEGLFLKKKIITNNQYIKEMNFFSEDNIYILGERRSIEEFMDKSFQFYPEDELEKYIFYNWIKNIIYYK